MSERESITTSAEQVFYSGWDRNLDFEKEKANLERLIPETKDIKRKAYFCIFLIQLANGSRIGEAVQAAKFYADNGARVQRVRVEKRKDKFMRLMIIPEVVRKEQGIREQIKAMNKKYADLTDSCVQYCRRNLGYNTHAQRYAFVGRMATELHPMEIAKLTGHKTLNYVLHYYQVKSAETKLNELVK